MGERWRSRTAEGHVIQPRRPSRGHLRTAKVPQCACTCARSSWLLCMPRVGECDQSSGYLIFRGTPVAHVCSAPLWAQITSRPNHLQRNIRSSSSSTPPHVAAANGKLPFMSVTLRASILYSLLLCIRDRLRGNNTLDRISIVFCIVLWYVQTLKLILRRKGSWDIVDGWVFLLTDFPAMHQVGTR